VNYKIKQGRFIDLFLLNATYTSEPDQACFLSGSECKDQFQCSKTKDYIDSEQRLCEPTLSHSVIEF